MNKRKLSKREISLLVLLLIIADLMGYLYTFYFPTVEATQDYITRTEDCKVQMELYDKQMSEKAMMEKELKALFDKNPNPLSMSPYDNLKKIVVELNGILQPMEDYTLTFGKIEEDGRIVHRPVTLGFNCSDYAAAKKVLKQLHDSGYRCLLDGINMSIPDGTGGEDGEGGGGNAHVTNEIVGILGGNGNAGENKGVSVQATMTYFEYKEEAPAPAETQAAPTE